jgi:hypothetical protein
MWLFKQSSWSQWTGWSICIARLSSGDRDVVYFASTVDGDDIVERFDNNERLSAGRSAQGVDKQVG